MVQNGRQNRCKIAKKTIRTSCFFYRPLDPKMEGKRVPEPAEMEAKMVQNRSQKRVQRKNEESTKTNNSPTFWRDFGCLRGWKIEEEIEKRVSKTIQNRRVILERIFKGFWSILVPFWNPGWTQNRKKRIKNKTDFKTNARERKKTKKLYPGSPQTSIWRPSPPTPPLSYTK